VSATQTPPSVVRFTSSNFQHARDRGGHHSAVLLLRRGVVITLLLSILLAYFLDPAVEFLERFGLPRTLGAMAMVLILISCWPPSATGYGEDRGFRRELAEYSSVLQQAAGAVEGKIRGIEGQVSQIARSRARHPRRRCGRNPVSCAR